MRKESIKFIGDLKWFSSSSTKGKYSSPRAALVDHIRYITRPQECVLKWNLDEKDWGRRADELLSKNARSRVASKVVFALPNSLSVSEGAELLREFLTKEQIFRTVKTRTITTEEGKKKRIRERIPVRLSPDDFGFAIHEGRNGVNRQRNLHAHVVFSSVKDGKKLDINRKELSELHKKWEEFLKEKGYHLRKSPIKEPHFGPQRLRFDSRARASYRHLTRAKRLWREAVEEEQIAKTLERAVQVQPAEGLLTWDEIAQEEERIATQGERKRESAQSPPPRPRPVKQSRPQQAKPVKQVKPVRSVKPVQQPRQSQPQISVLSQRPSHADELEQKVKDPVKRIQKEMQRELAEKRKRERQLASEINYSLRKRARAANSPPPPSVPSYPKEKTPQEVGMQNLNPFITQEVVEAEEQEIQRKEQKKQIRQAEMEITYLYRFKDSQNVYKGTLTVKFRTLASWNREQTKTVAAFLATIVVARLYGFEYPEDSLSFYGKFVYRETVQVEEGIKEYMSKKGIKPLYSSQDEALRALSVKRAIFVRVRIYENGKLVEQFSFYLTKESFTIMERYAEEVRRRRRPPEPGGQPGQPGQPPQPQQPGYQDDEEEPDWPEPPGM